MLTAKEIIEFLGISQAMLYKLLKQGLPVVKVGSNNRFEKDEVVKWLKEQQNLKNN